MSRIYKFYRTFSFILFLLSLLIVYAYLPEDTGYLFNESDEPVKTVTRAGFFYFNLFLFVLLNGSFFFLEKYLTIRLNRLRSLTFADSLMDWLRCFNGSTNVFIIMVMFFVGFANSPEFFHLKNVVYLVYLGLMILLGTIVWLPFIIFKKTG